MEWLADRANWEIALFAGMAWLVGVPMIVSIYYHWKVRRIPGGKALREAQSARMPSSNAGRSLGDAVDLWKGLRGGAFSGEARRLVARATWALVAWAMVAVVGFGALLYVDAQMQQRGGWPEFSTGQDPSSTAVPAQP